MAWGTIRPVSDDDYEQLNKAARRFVARHPEIKNRMYTDDPMKSGRWFGAVDTAIDSYDAGGAWNDVEHGKYLKILWRRVVRRALDEPDSDGIAYGYVGYYCD